MQYSSLSASTWRWSGRGAPFSPWWRRRNQQRLQSAHSRALAFRPSALWPTTWRSMGHGTPLGLESDDGDDNDDAPDMNESEFVTQWERHAASIVFLFSCSFETTRPSKSWAMRRVH
mmetsp:Transcript_25840/g.72666  ORF Transcript_25840/g.72666 Transcript_25840/m.72666 type:complete len:117 (-) Transcript_25840:16-366(-)